MVDENHKVDPCEGHDTYPPLALLPFRVGRFDEQLVADKSEECLPCSVGKIIIPSHPTQRATVHSPRFPSWREHYRLLPYMDSITIYGQTLTTIPKLTKPTKAKG